MDRFVDRSAGRSFLLACLATLLAGLSVAQLSAFAHLAGELGHGPGAVGLLIAIYGVAVIGANLAGGHVMGRIGPSRAARLAIAIMAAGFLAAHWTRDEPSALAVTRLVQGAGYGLFVPAATAYIRPLLGPRTPTYLMGIFTAMLLAPQAIGPAVAAELVLRFGDFFLVGSLPLLLAVLCWPNAGRPASMSPSVPAAARKSDSGGVVVRGLWATLVSAELRPVIATALGLGCGIGLGGHYAAAALLDRGEGVSQFFVPMTVSIFVTRFILAPRLEGLARQQLMMATALTMSLAHASLALDAAGGIVPAGILFGAAVGLSHPNLTLWSSDLVGPVQLPVALSAMNAALNLGTFGAPLVAAPLIAAWSYSEAFALAATICAATAMAHLVALGRRARRAASDGGIVVEN